MKRFFQFGWLLPFLSLFFIHLPAAQATTVVALDLAQTIKFPQARVFVGKCISSASSNISNGWPVLNYVFKIEEIIRAFNKPGANTPAAVGDEISITVYNGIKGVPVFQCDKVEGEEGVYAFTSPSRLGLSSPVALDRGVWRFTGGVGSQTVSLDSFSGIKKLNIKASAVGNGKNLEVNSKALVKLQKMPQTGGEIDRASFVQVVKGIANGDIEAANNSGGAQ